MLWINDWLNKWTKCVALTFWSVVLCIPVFLISGVMCSGSSDGVFSNVCHQWLVSNSSYITIGVNPGVLGVSWPPDFGLGGRRVVVDGWWNIIISYHYYILSCTGSMFESDYLRHFSLTVAGLRAPLSRFLEGALYKYPEWMNEWMKRNRIICLEFSCKWQILSG